MRREGFLRNNRVLSIRMILWPARASQEELQLPGLDQEHAAAGMADRQWSSTQPADPPPTMTWPNCRLSIGAFIPEPRQKMVCGGAQKTPPQTRSLEIALGLGDQERA